MKVSMADELVSVIVPCYNYSRFLPDVFCSLISQSYKEWECIVVDDGSVDDTRQITEFWSKSDSRIRYLFQEHQGLSAARNTGLREARGSLLQFLDADDLLESEKFKVQTQFLAENPATDLVYGNFEYFSSIAPDGTVNMVSSQNRPYMQCCSGDGIALLETLIWDNPFVVSAPLLRKRLLDFCDPFDEKLKSHEDWDLWLRCALAGGRFDCLDTPGTATLIRLHGQSMSKNTAVMRSTGIEVRRKIQPHIFDQSLLVLNSKLMGSARIHFGIDKIKRGSFGSGCLQLLFGVRQGGGAELWKLVLGRMGHLTKKD